jgi:hypothetical protein
MSIKLDRNSHAWVNVGATTFSGTTLSRMPNDTHQNDSNQKGAAEQRQAE